MIDINDFERKYGCEMVLLVLCCRSLLQDSPMRKLGFYLISFKQRFIQAKWIFE